MRRPADKLLLSFREADRSLGARHGTTAELVSRKVIRSVPWFDGQRVPLEELERIARQGVDATGRRPRARRLRTHGNTDPAALMALRLEDLR
jgi:hypothetical protein